MPVSGPLHDGREPDASQEPPEEPPGTVGITGPRPLVAFAVVGLVAGWAVRPLAFRWGYVEPSVPFATIALLFFVASVVGGSAYVTWRVVRRDRASLAHHQAVNRLVLGKAVALVGALIVGGYLGYALAQLGVGEPAAQARLWRSLVAALGGAAMTTAALLLEHACRVPPEDS